MIKSGDLVRITRSDRNWSPQMDAYVGRKFVVEYVREGQNTQGATQIVSFRNASREINNWSWVYEDGHFEVIPFTVSVGDLVTIKRGRSMWSENMNRYIGLSVVVTDVYWYASFDGDFHQCIRFSGYNEWYFSFEDGMFTLNDKPRLRGVCEAYMQDHKVTAYRTANDGVFMIRGVGHYHTSEVRSDDTTTKRIIKYIRNICEGDDVLVQVDGEFKIKTVTSRQGNRVVTDSGTYGVDNTYLVKSKALTRENLKKGIEDGLIPSDWNRRLKQGGRFCVTIYGDLAFPDYVAQIGSHYYRKDDETIVQLYDGSWGLIDDAVSCMCEGEEAYTIHDYLCINDEFYIDTRENRNHYGIVYQQDTNEYAFEDDSIEYEGEWYSDNYCPPERWLYDYHNGPRANHTKSDTIFKIAFEVEKEDEDVLTVETADALYSRTGWCKERDGSLGDNGFEAISPIYDLMKTDFVKEFAKVKHILDAEYSSSCGGHINFSEVDRSGQQTFEDVYGYIPLLYAMYPNRLDKQYSEAKSKSRLIANRDKYSSVFIKDRFIEFRIFSAVRSMDNLLWRAELIKIMAENMTSDPYHMLSFLLNRKHKLHKHLLKVYSVDDLLDKTRLVIKYMKKYDSVELPKHRKDHIEKIGQTIKKSYKLDATITTEVESNNL
jgi:hypothetical protein